MVVVGIGVATVGVGVGVGIVVTEGANVEKVVVVAAVGVLNDKVGVGVGSSHCEAELLDVKSVKSSSSFEALALVNSPKETSLDLWGSSNVECSVSNEIA